jgi:hypothetical protein
VTFGLLRPSLSSRIFHDSGAVSRRPERPLLAFFASLLTLCGGVSCADLPSIERGICGNGVLDVGEDCDGPSDTGVCGASGAVGECRFVCDPAAAVSGCPAGFGCGTDTICRRGDGKFTLSTSGVPAGVDVIAVGDFGGRGSKTVYAQSLDVLGLGSPRLIRFDASGAALQSDTTSIPASLGAPQVADLDGDGLKDVVSAASDGVAVFLGDGPTTLVAEAFDSYRPPPGTEARIGIINVFGFLSEGVLIARLPDEQGQLQTLVLPRDTANAEDPVVVLPVPPSALGTHTASVVGIAPKTACSRPLAVARETKFIGVYDACYQNEAGDLVWEQPKPTPLPSVLVTTQQPIFDGAWVLRADGDPYEDILVFTHRPGAGGQLLGLWEIAFGDGQGSFASRPPGDPDAKAGQTSSFRLDFEGEAATPFSVAAIGDLRQPLDVQSSLHDVPIDGVPVNVLVVAGARAIGTTAITFDKPLGPAGLADFSLTITSTTFRTEPWETARVGDVTGDGLLDVVAGSKRNLDLDLYTGTDAFLFNGSRIETGNPTGAIVLGDFDGDRINDVAFASPQSETEHTLSIAYGQAFSPPAAVVTIGSYPPIVQMEAANLTPGGSLPTYDLTSDLGIVTEEQTPNGPQSAVAILRGSGNRLPLATLNLAQFIPVGPEGGEPQNYQGLPFAVGAAKTAEGLPRLDVLAAEAAGTNASGDARYELRIWSVADVDTKTLSRAGGAIPGCTTELPRAASTVLDVNNDGVEESAFLVVCDTSAALAIVANTARDASTLTVNPANPLSFSWAPRNVLPVSIVAGDVDGDGFTDLVVTLSAFQADGANALASLIDRLEPTTAILWNRGGTFDYANAAAVLPTGDGSKVGAATFLDIGGQKRLVVATDAGIWVVFAPATPGDPLSYAPLPTTLANAAKLDRIRSLAAGDVSGDGIDDLIVGRRPGTLQVFVGSGQ